MWLGHMLALIMALDLASSSTERDSMVANKTIEKSDVDANGLASS